MTREHFVNIAREAVDSLPDEFRRRIHNVALLVEDRPAEEIQRRRPHGSPPAPSPCSSAPRNAGFRRRL